MDKAYLVANTMIFKRAGQTAIICGMTALGNGGAMRLEFAKTAIWPVGLCNWGEKSIPHITNQNIRRILKFC
jgi:hypothetical protein